MAERKRIRVKYKTPNPLFERWLTEWYNQAKVNDSQMQFTFNAALKSLRKYPLPLETGTDCLILKGFGNKLCGMLEKKLNNYKLNQNNERHSPDLQQNDLQQNNLQQNDLQQNDLQQNDLQQNVAPRNQPPKKANPATKSTRPYKPVKNSGPYAILLALLKKQQEPNNPGCFTKAEIIEHAKHLCDKSFAKPEPGSFYTAWTSMSTLVSKGLVIKKGSPVKFKLSEAGEQLAFELFQEMDNSIPETDNLIFAQNITNTMRNITSETSNMYSEHFSQNSDVVASCSQQTDVYSLENTNSQASSTSKTSKTSKTSETSETAEIAETIIFRPGNFDIILLVDTHETNGGPRNPADDETTLELDKYPIKYEVRHLKVGDFTWICREKGGNNELVLPYIAERKRMDDLGHSIKDGRFHEQKFRLKQCGIQNLIYIVENYGNNTRTCLPLSSLLQAATNTLVQDEFQVKFTESQRHSMQYLAGITMMLSHVYEQKTLMSCAKDQLETTNVMDDLIPLMVFKEFNKGASKSKKFKVKEIFLRQLLQLSGVSVDKALAIANKYPTPRLLKMEYDVLDAAQGEKLLANIPFGPLKKCIGPVISKTIYQLFTINSLN